MSPHLLKIKDTVFNIKCFVLEPNISTLILD